MDTEEQEAKPSEGEAGLLPNPSGASGAEDGDTGMVMMSATSQGARFGESELSMEKVWKKCVLRKSESVVKVLPGFQEFAAKCGHAKKVLP